MLPYSAFGKTIRTLTGLRGRCHECERRCKIGLWTTQDELRHIQRLGRHTDHGFSAESLLETYLATAELRDWGNLDKDRCVEEARTRLDRERAWKHE